MPASSLKGDLRIKKTYKALMDAMDILLEKRNFNQVSVNELCEHAQVSRTTFYTHFHDKYHLLQYYLEYSIPAANKGGDPFTLITNALNCGIFENAKITRNICENANSDTTQVLQDFVGSIVNWFDGDGMNDEIKTPEKMKLLSVFFSGGVVNFVLWQLKNLPEHAPVMNTYLNDMLRHLLKWARE